MADYEYLIAMNLHAKLKEKIVGKIYVTVSDDKLYVRIDSFENLTWDLSIPNFSQMVLNGFSTERIAEDIATKFKKYVIKKTVNKYMK
jgi:AAA15 family ATPase/GTPase